MCHSYNQFLDFYGPLTLETSTSWQLKVIQSTVDKLHSADTKKLGLIVRGVLEDAFALDNEIVLAFVIGDTVMSSDIIAGIMKDKKLSVQNGVITDQVFCPVYTPISRLCTSLHHYKLIICHKRQHASSFFPHQSWSHCWKRGCLLAQARVVHGMTLEMSARSKRATEDFSRYTPCCTNTHTYTQTHTIQSFFSLHHPLFLHKTNTHFP